MTFPMGKWEYCGFRIQLERIRTKYLAESYAPSCIFVILSWLSFIIKPDAIPGRIMLLLNIFLVLILLMNNAKESTPDVNRINAIDVYIAACNIHVFFAILEYASTLTTDVKDASSVQKESTSSFVSIRYISILLFHRLDWISLIIFPFSFMIFNIYYWNNL